MFLNTERPLSSLAFGLASASDECNQNYRHSQNPHDSRNNSICNGSSLGVAGQRKTKPSVYDAERDDHLTPPDMRVSNHVWTTSLLIKQVVYQASERLKEQASDHYESNDCIVGTE